MHLNPIHRTRARRQQGLTLLESLVAIVVLALGVLGMLGVQMRTLAETQTGVRRAQAVRLIEDLSERIKSNPRGWTSWKTTSPTGTPPLPPQPTAPAQPARPRSSPPGT